MSKTVTKVEKKTTTVKINNPSNNIVKELSDNEDIFFGLKKDELFDGKEMKNNILKVANKSDDKDKKVMEIKKNTKKNFKK
jgi:hypothetical protein